MTSVNTLVAGNIAIPTYSELNITSIGLVTIADNIVEKFTEIIVLGKIKEHDDNLTFKKACLLENDPSFDAKHKLLIK